MGIELIDTRYVKVHLHLAMVFNIDLNIKIKVVCISLKTLSNHEMFRNATGMSPLSVKLHNDLSRYGGVHETGYNRG